MAMSRFPARFGTSRTPARWDDPFVDLQREVNQAFEDLFRGFRAAPSRGEGAAMVAPRLDIDEDDEAIQISAELPGVKMEEVDVSLEDDVLTIRGEKRRERRDERARVSERSYGAFQRTIQLPFAPDPDEVQAQFENGVLMITLPKRERAHAARKIEVRTGEGGQAAQNVGTQGSEDQGGQSGKGADVAPPESAR